MTGERFKELKKRFDAVGWTLTKQRRWDRRLGYYAIEQGKERFNDWKWVGSSLESASQSIIINQGCEVRKRRRPSFNIKNWKKSGPLSWENTKTYSGVSVEKLGDSYYVEERYITRVLEIEKRRILAQDLTKEQAIKRAYAYMRRNGDFR